MLHVHGERWKSEHVVHTMITRVEALPRHFGHRGSRTGGVSPASSVVSYDGIITIRDDIPTQQARP